MTLEFTTPNNTCLLHVCRRKDDGTIEPIGNIGKNEQKTKFILNVYNNYYPTFTQEEFKEAMEKLDYINKTYPLSRPTISGIQLL